MRILDDGGDFGEDTRRQRKGPKSIKLYFIAKAAAVRAIEVKVPA